MQAIEHDFRAARRASENLLACYQHFLGHDLPNRLVAAQGLARIVLTDTDTSMAELRPLLERLADLIRQADEEGRQLATLGRLVRDMEPPTPIDLGELYREAIAEACWLCPDVECCMAGNLPTAAVSGNLARALLVQVLRIAVVARLPGTPLQVKLGAEANGEDVVFHIRHNGSGMSAEKLGLLAELLDNGQADHASLGPGWLLVRHLVAACGGAIRVSSEPGAPTMVSLTLREPATLRGPLR